jgi:hypothetical protein
VRDATTPLGLRIPDASGPLAVVTQTLSEDGARSIAARTLPTRPALRFEAALPARLRAGETLTVPLRVIPTSESVRAARVTVEADAPLTARLVATAGEDAPSPLVFDGAGRAETRALVLAVPADATPRTVTLRVQATSDDAPTRALTHTLTIDDGRPLRRATHGALLDAPRTLAVDVPADARVLDAALVVTAPDALPRDPEARALAPREPALLAWADALADGAPATHLYAAVAAARRDDPREDGDDPDATLRVACALVALSAASDADRDGLGALARLQERLHRDLYETLPISFAAARRIARAQRTPRDTQETDADAHRLALHAAVAAALAAGLPTVPTDARAPSLDPSMLTSDVERLRGSLRARFATVRSTPGAVARIAAALLLHRGDDPEARAMAALAARSLVTASGLRFLPRDAGAASPHEDLGGTFALAVAARQLGEAALLARLQPTLAQRVDRALAAGGETTFWALAAGVYGALGAPTPDAPTQVTIRKDGERRTLPVSGTSTRIPLAAPAPGETLRLDLAPAPGAAPRLARLVVTYTRAPDARRDASLALSLHGDPGRVGGRSALELVVENTGRDTVDAAVLDVALPAGARADDDTEAALVAGGGVAAVRTADARGVLRVRLAPLRGGERRTLPLTLRWLAHGMQSGFFVVAWDDAAPERLSVLSPRTLTIAPGDDTP